MIEAIRTRLADAESAQGPKYQTLRTRHRRRHLQRRLDARDAAADRGGARADCCPTVSGRFRRPMASWSRAGSSCARAGAAASSHPCSGRWPSRGIAGSSPTTARSCRSTRGCSATKSPARTRAGRSSSGSTRRSSGSIAPFRSIDEFEVRQPVLHPARRSQSRCFGSRATRSRPPTSRPSSCASSACRSAVLQTIAIADKKDVAPACDPLTAASRARSNRLHGGERRRLSMCRKSTSRPIRRKLLFESELRY